VIPEIDIWRAAQLVVKRYGEQALEQSAARFELTNSHLPAMMTERRLGDESWRL
jgi:hypothetical protein